MDFNNFGKSFGDKMMSRMFKPVNDVVWDMASGNIGVIKNGSIFTLSGEGENAVVTENLFSDFGITIPAFAQNTPFESVKLGDLVYRQLGENRLDRWSGRNHRDNKHRHYSERW